MELIEIERHAKALMTAHGVGSLAFEFDRGKRRIGATHVLVFNRGQSNEMRIPKKITLSKHFAALMSDDEIHDVILHEIAHALTPGDGHGAKWRAAARKVGATPSRCKAVAASPETSVSGVCTNPDCQKVVVSQHRLPLRVSFHRTCGRAYPLRWFKNGRMMKVSDMPSRYQSEYMRNYSK